MKNQTLTLGSLFDGSGGFPLGGILSGITPIWASEIEPFPIRVTTKRLPSVKHLGDINEIKGNEITPVDIITFGSPCQDLSIAGRRNGLEGSKSSLFFQAIRIIKEMREATNEQYPRYIVWENVPGAFSSNKGKDFQEVLKEICSVRFDNVSIPIPKKWKRAGLIMEDNFSLAWRVFDAQYWGVPQRRKRIYLVADFDGRSASKILFESEGLSRYTSPCFAKGEDTTSYIERSLRKPGSMCINDQGGNRIDINEEKSLTLKATASQPPLVFQNHGQDARYKGPLEKADTILSTYGMGGNNQPFVVESPKTLKVRSGKEGGGKGALVQENKSATLSCNNDQTLFVPSVFQILAKDSYSMLSDNPNVGISEVDKSRCIDTTGSNPACNQGGICIVDKKDIPKEMVEAFHINQRNELIDLKDKSGALMKTRNVQMQTFILEKSKEVYSSSKSSFFTYATKEKAATLVSCDNNDPPIVNKSNRSESKYAVRRLTPTECARLQGFPSWWCSDLATDIPSIEEIELWKKIFRDYAKATGKITREKTDNQIKKWLLNPYSDTAEYKMWGNGVALVNVVYVLSAINYYANEREENEN